ncbi:hypothetical protein [Paeniglutamicibacter cryotolerans]|nr:hypothetical protein [Paeniglutamicibacter cryotolerans]
MKEIAVLDGAAAGLRGLLMVAGFVLVLLTLAAAVRIVVGILDLGPRRSIPGVVVSISERRFLDFLPDQLNNALWDRGPNVGWSWSERRKVRHELVIDTGSGTHAWTLRDAKKASGIRAGQQVTLVVSPLVGFVDRLESSS